MREAVGFARVHGFAGPNEVFPGVLAAAGAGHDVVEAAFVGTQDAASVLAAVVVALADGAGAELGALLRHFGEVDGDNDGRHADCAAHGVNGVVLRADGERDPLVPRYGTDGLSAEDGVGPVAERRGVYFGAHFPLTPALSLGERENALAALGVKPLTLTLSPSDGERESGARFVEFDFEGGGDVGGHHAEGLLRRADVDGLPVAVEDEDDGFVQYGHVFVK